MSPSCVSEATRGAEGWEGFDGNSGGLFSAIAKWIWLVVCSLWAFYTLEHASEVHAHFLRLILRAVLYISGFLHPSHRQWKLEMKGAHIPMMWFWNGETAFSLWLDLLSDSVWIRKCKIAEKKWCEWWFHLNPGVVQSQWQHTWKEQTLKKPLMKWLLISWHLLPCADRWFLGFLLSCPATLVPSKYICICSKHPF